MTNSGVPSSHFPIKCILVKKKIKATYVVFQLPTDHQTQIQWCHWKAERWGEFLNTFQNTLGPTCAVS